MSRTASITQAEVTRRVRGAVRGALAEGLQIAEVRLDGDVVTILTSASQGRAGPQIALDASKVAAARLAAMESDETENTLLPGEAR